MSYVIGPTFGGNFMGVRRLRSVSGLGRYAGMRGLGYLGDTQGDADAAVAVGLLDSGTASFLISAGATDQDFINLLNGTTDLSTLMVRYTTGNPVPVPPGLAPVSLPAALASNPPAPIVSTPVNPLIAPAAPNVTATATGGNPTTAQSPPGSTLLYTASWPGSNALPQSILNSLTQQLPRYGYQVSSSSVTGAGLLGSSAISITLIDTVGHDTIANAESIPNSLLQALIGSNFTPSMVLLQSGAGLNPAIPNLNLPGAANLTTWFEQNWGYLAVALAAIVVLPPLVKKL